MRKVRLYSPIEEVEVEVGGESATIKLDLSKDRLLDIAAACQKAKRSIATLEALEKKAKSKKEKAEIDKKVNQAITPAMKEVLGDEQYKKVLAMCGCDDTFGAGTRTLVLMPLLACAMAAIAERTALLDEAKETIGQTAAHPEGDNDALQPDEAE